MLFKNIVSAGLLLLVTTISQAKTAADDLILALVDKHLPKVLYAEQDRAWELGHYDLVVHKQGDAHFTSTDKWLGLTLPVQVKIRSRINKQIFGSQIVMNCATNIVTETQLRIYPIIKKQGSAAIVDIQVPVPPSELDCDGLKVPITPLLKAIVIKEKKTWRQQLEQDIQRLMQQVGL